MFDAVSIGIFFTAFSVGMLHAFDADHVLAVASLAGAKNKFATIVKFSLKWGMGHGGVLILCGALFLFWGVELNPAIVNLAELGIGVILIIAGSHLLWTLKTKKIQVIEHSHGGHEHTHLVEIPNANAEELCARSDHDHSPVLVGFMHGLAGSAPVIALLPSLMLANSFSPLLYLCLFSVGCLLGMVFFGVILAKAQTTVQKISARAITVFRSALGVGAILFGVYWLFA